MIRVVLIDTKLGFVREVSLKLKVLTLMKRTLQWLSTLQLECS